MEFKHLNIAKLPKTIVSSFRQEYPVTDETHKLELLDELAVYITSLYTPFLTEQGHRHRNPELRYSLRKDDIPNGLPTHDVIKNFESELTGSIMEYFVNDDGRFNWTSLKLDTDYAPTEFLLKVLRRSNIDWSTCRDFHAFFPNKTHLYLHYHKNLDTGKCKFELTMGAHTIHML